MSIDPELLDALPISDLSKNQLPNYLKFIQGPDSLQAIAGVSLVFLTLIKSPGFDNFPFKEALKFKKIAKELSTLSKKELPRKYQKAAQKRSDDVEHPFGIINEYPLYALLYYHTNINHDIYINFQKALLTIIHRPSLNAKLITKSDIRAYSLFIRSITDNHVAHKWLSEMPTSKLDSLNDAYELLLKYKEQLLSLSNLSKKEINLKQQLHGALRLLKASVGVKVIRHLTQDTAKKRASAARESLGTRGVCSLIDNNYIELLVPGDDDDLSEAPSIYNVIKHDLSPQDENELEALDVEIDELEPDFDFIFTRDQDIPAYAQAINNALRAKGALKRIERQNQFLPLDTQQLNDHDVVVLSKLLKKLDTHPQDKALGMLLRVILATSSHIDRAKNLIIITDDSVEIGEDEIGFDLKNQQWLIPVLSLKLKTSVKEESKAISRFNDTNILHLPDTLHFNINLHKNYEEAIPERPFKNLKNIEKRIRAILKSTDSRLTLTRLSNYLTLKAASRFEATQATYLFSNYLASSSARRYYLTLSQADYQVKYQQLCNDLLPLKYKVDINNTKAYEQESEVIGGRYCPHPDHIVGSLKKIEESLNTLKKKIQQFNEPNAWIDFHNLYTVYNIYAQGFLTGIRSVTDPFVGSNQMIKELNIAIFRDKCAEDQFHTRNIFLHPLTIKFCEYYEAHKLSVYSKLALLNPNSVLELRGLTLEKPPNTFFLKSSGDWYDAKPSTINKFLSSVTPLPLNSNRKYIRTRLTELKLPPHSIDSLMGHGNSGEMFWQTFATQPFQDISKELLKGLNLIIDKLKLKPLKGF